MHWEKQKVKKMFDRFDIGGDAKLSLPTPEFYVLYNGVRDCPEESLMRLSDSFMAEKPENSAELVVKMYNLAYTKGARVLERSRLLAGYSRLVSLSREYVRQGMGMEKAVRLAVGRCQQEHVLADFLKQHGTEVLGMLYDVVTREEYGDIREKEGRTAGLAAGRVDSILDLLWDKGEISDALQRKIKEEKDPETLRRWLRLAGRVLTVEEFAGKMQ